MKLKELLKEKGTKYQRIADVLGIVSNGSLGRRIEKESIDIVELRLLRKMRILSSEDIIELTK